MLFVNIYYSALINTYSVEARYSPTGLYPHYAYTPNTVIPPSIDRSQVFPQNLVGYTLTTVIPPAISRGVGL